MCLRELLEAFDYLEKVFAKTAQKGAGVFWDWIAKAGRDIAEGVKEGWKEGMSDDKNRSSKED